MPDRSPLLAECLGIIEAVHGAETRQDVETVIDEGREAFRADDDEPEIEEIDAVIRCPGCRANPAPVVLVADVWCCHFCGEEVDPER